jgi:tRNA pseudouridine38-40 synthase
MKNVKLTIEFDGTAYKGWQTQLNDKTVQDEIETRILIITKEKVSLHSSGRTDAGVHAKRMTANFLIEKELDLKRFKRSLNAVLPEDITVTEAEHVSTGFHSRKSAKKKIYEYHILNRETKSPFLKNYSWHIDKPLEVDKMIKASKSLIGEHDFTGFASTGGSVKSNVRTIYDIDIKKDGDNIIMTFTGSGFLKQMVRNIAGLLVQVGKGKFSEEFVSEVLKKRTIKKPYVTAPSKGLFLKDVLY